MELKNSGHMPDPSLSREEMEELQERIAADAVFENRFDFSLDGVQDLKVAGVDQAFLDDRAVSGVVILRDGEVVERAHATASLEIPYMPGLLAFREAPAMIKALEKLSIEPDLLMLDGSGRIHFRQAGIAVHVGVLFDVPAVGVAKSLLCGERESPTRDLAEGGAVRILAGDRMDASKGTHVGYAYQSRQFESDSRSINPLYLSPGHRTDEDASLDVVRSFCEGYKLPEPVRLADRYVGEKKQDL